MSELPMQVRADGLPSAVTIYEVGPRDGLQNEKSVVPSGWRTRLTTLPPPLVITASASRSMECPYA